jgi:ParB family chromosome partitioning protein
MSLKKRGLGRGLEALLGSGGLSDMETPATTAAAVKDGAQRLPIEFLQSSRFQPRKDFDPARLQELADSISAQGVIQPVVVRPIGENRYEIIAGERRWRAAQLARLHDIPVVVRPVTDQAALAIALIENIQREDLTPLEEAEALRRLQEEFTLTHQQIADAVGKSRATVTNLLRLNDLAPEAKALLQQGQIEMGHARAILGLERQRQGEIAALVATKGLNVRETEALVRKLQENPAPAPPAVKSHDPDIARLEERVTQSLGAKAQIKHGDKGAGKLIISYDSLDQLEGVLERLE